MYISALFAINEELNTLQNILDRISADFLEKSEDVKISSYNGEFQLAIKRIREYRETGITQLTDGTTCLDGSCGDPPKPYSPEPKTQVPSKMSQLERTITQTILNSLGYPVDTQQITVNLVERDMSAIYIFIPSKAILAANADRKEYIAGSLSLGFQTEPEFSDYDTSIDCATDTYVVRLIKRNKS
jgi:hypothetical protein